METFHEITVTGVIQETPDARSFLLQPPPALREAYRYKAGQFLTFEIPFQGMKIKRCYSMSSSPDADPHLKVTVKRVAGGRGSNWFNDQVHVGTRIGATAPEGHFTLRAGRDDHPLTLFGGGSGITPVFSILKTALVGTGRNVALVYANRDEASVIFKKELDLWQRFFPDRLKVVHHLDSSGGFLSKDRVKEVLRDRMNGDFYVCGPTPFMDLVDAALNDLGAPSDARFFERFVSPTDPDRRPAEEPAAAAAPAAGLPASFTMVLDGKTAEVPYVKGKSLLHSAHDAGHKPPSSCEDGYCGACTAFLRSGKVQMKVHDALTPQLLKDGWILPCQARPAAGEKIVVDFDRRL